MKRNLRSEAEATDPVRRMLRLTRKAELNAFEEKRDTIKEAVTDVGTGYTILKLKDHPIGKLFDEHKLVPEAVTAADEIHTAFHAIASRVMIRPGCLERIDGRGRGDMPWPAKISRSVSNYQVFARHWTKRANLGDPMLEVLIAVVIDERSIRDVAYQVVVHHSRIKRAVIAGLQDYAARSENIAKILSSGKAARWKEEAERVLPVLEVGLRFPAAKTRIAAAELEKAVDAARGI